jgi:hypothetical protein
MIATESIKLMMILNMIQQRVSSTVNILSKSAFSIDDIGLHGRKVTRTLTTSLTTPTKTPTVPRKTVKPIARDLLEELRNA